MARQVEALGGVRHTARRMSETPKRGRGRPRSSAPLATISGRAPQPVRDALDVMAKRQRRNRGEMLRIIVGERLIAEGLLPKDAEF